MLFFVQKLRLASLRGLIYRNR